MSDRLTWREAANEARDSAHAYRGMMDDAVARWRDLVMRCDAAAQVLTLADRGHLKLTPAAAVEEARGEAPEQPGGVRSGTLRARQLRLCEVMFERIVVEAEDGRRMIQWEARTEWRPEAGKRPADLFRAIAVAEGKPQEKWDNIRRYFDNVVDKVPEAFPGGLPGRDDLQGWWRLGMTWSSQFTE